MEDDYIDTITILENIRYREVGYVNLLWMVSLGILFEIDRKDLRRIACVVEKEKIDDTLMDFLLNACDINWSHITNQYEKENPYAKTAEIIQAALQSKDQETATKKLQSYMDNEWFKGHYDYEWRNAHKEPGYVGFWSFETAALVKILGLNDNIIKENNHYPYELSHYKHEMNFKVKWKNIYLEKEMNDAAKVCRIINNSALEQIIPEKYYGFVNDVINDYVGSNDEEFWKKYKLDVIWFDLEEYRKNNEDRDLLGTIIVFLLVDKGFILQLDYKEDLKDYIENIHNCWPAQEVKLVCFKLNNDQNYYAYIPRNAMIDSMYEVKIVEVN